MLSTTWACKGLKNICFKFVTVRSTLPERVLISGLPVRAMVRFKACPCNWSSSAASFELKELVKHESSMAFIFSCISPIFTYQCWICYQWNMFSMPSFVCLSWAQLSSGAETLVFVPVSCQVLGSRLSCSWWNGGALACSWPWLVYCMIWSMFMQVAVRKLPPSSHFVALGHSFPWWPAAGNDVCV